ncbi:MAG TPA: YfiR family protein [Burkholderiaceae bacterium]|nr:YfiR family protein [Burkholderiaceae bacterium]
MKRGGLWWRWFGGFGWGACLLSWLSLLPCALAADVAALPEQQVKAAYILNFARYASWPAATLADPRAPLVVCMIGQDAGEIARRLQSRAAGSHPLELRTITRDEEGDACHALYIGASEKARQGALLARLRDQAILTIGDSTSFLADGGMINLLLVDGTIRFEVNLAAAKRSGMSLNPRVLALAERVLGGAPK